MVVGTFLVVKDVLNGVQLDAQSGAIGHRRLEVAEGDVVLRVLVEDLMMTITIMRCQKERSKVKLYRTVTSKTYFSVSTAAFWPKIAFWPITCTTVFRRAPSSS